MVEGGSGGGEVVLPCWSQRVIVEVGKRGPQSMLFSDAPIQLAPHTVLPSFDGAAANAL